MQRLRVSDNQRFLVTENGDPFFWLGDTAWELFHRCTQEEAEFYLENRRRKGFNVIQAVALAEIDGLRDPNPYGHVPFLDDDPARPNESYFYRVDSIIRAAEAHGIYIALLPTWGDKVNLAWGKGPVVFNEQTAHHYGRWIGRRYRDQTNIIWVNGGDRREVQDGVDYAPVWRALAAGIIEGAGDSVLMTYHTTGQRSSSEVFHNDEWLHFNMWQSGHHHRDQNVWDMITSDYERQPTKPVLDGEPNYEDHGVNPFVPNWNPDPANYFRDYDVRKQAYRAVFAGAFGHTYGHHSIWQMVTEKRQPINYPDRTWLEALDRPGAYQMGYLRRLMESRPFLNRVPDQSLIAVQSEDDARHMRATRADDGSYAMIYVPDAREAVTVNTSVLAGTRLRAWWYDTATGGARLLGEIENTGTYQTPTANEDGVLVLDSIEAGFGAPGSTW